MEKITFCPEDGEAVEFFVLEQTRLGGVDYILVTDSEDEDAEALILKDVVLHEKGARIYSFSSSISSSISVKIAATASISLSSSTML